MVLGQAYKEAYYLLVKLTISVDAERSCSMLHIIIVRGKLKHNDV